MTISSDDYFLLGLHSHLCPVEALYPHTRSVCSAFLDTGALPGRPSLCLPNPSPSFRLRPVQLTLIAHALRAKTED